MWFPEVGLHRSCGRIARMNVLSVIRSVYRHCRCEGDLTVDQKALQAIFPDPFARALRCPIEPPLNLHQRDHVLRHWFTHFHLNARGAADGFCPTILPENLTASAAASTANQRPPRRRAPQPRPSSTETRQVRSDTNGEDSGFAVYSLILRVMRQPSWHFKYLPSPLR